MHFINNISSHVSSNIDEINIAINRVLKSGFYILGEEVSRFEKNFAEYCGTRKCVSTANGTDAIELALRTAGISPGDKVAVVANAGMYSSTAVLAIGAVPFFMDVDYKTSLVRFDDIANAYKNNVKAVIVTHLYGSAIKDIEMISAFCKANNLFLIEDCAQAHGARVNDKSVGSFGNIGCFSFYPTKNLGALGDGGAIITNNDNYADTILALRQYGWKNKKYQSDIRGGRNSRLDELQAAILNCFLPKLNSWNLKRREIANKYSELIDNEFIEKNEKLDTSSVAHLYVIRCSRRADLINYLSDRNIACDIHYPIPDYKQLLFEGIFDTVFLENTEALASNVLSLPCYPELTMAEVGEIIKIINEFK